MFSKYTIFLITNLLIANRVLGASLSDEDGELHAILQFYEEPEDKQLHMILDLKEVGGPTNPVPIEDDYIQEDEEFLTILQLGEKQMSAPSNSIQVPDSSSDDENEQLYMDLDLTEEVDGPSNAIQVPDSFSDNVGAPSSSAPHTTEDHVGAPSNPILQLGDDELLGLSFDDCRRYAKRKYDFRQLKARIALNDLLEYFGDYDAVKKSTINYLDAKNISPAKRRSISLTLYCEIVRDYCRVTKIPIAKFVEWRWQGKCQARNPDLQ